MFKQLSHHVLMLEISNSCYTVEVWEGTFGVLVKNKDFSRCDPISNIRFDCKMFLFQPPGAPAAPLSTISKSLILYL